MLAGFVYSSQCVLLFHSTSPKFQPVHKQYPESEIPQPKPPIFRPIPLFDNFSVENFELEKCVISFAQCNGMIL